MDAHESDAGEHAAPRGGDPAWPTSRGDTTPPLTGWATYSGAHVV